MERQYRTLLGTVLTTLLLLGTYLTDLNNDDDFYDINSEHERSWQRSLQIDDPTSAAAVKPQEDSQHTSGTSHESGVNNPPTIKIFYNLFVKGPEDSDRVVGMFHEQLAEMDPSLHDVAFVHSVGYLPPEISSSSSSEQQYVVEHHEEGGEDGALHALWDYCRANDDHETKVVYLHSKGSFHPLGSNDRLRRFLTEGALSEECATLPDKCNVCSSRMSPHPHPHTSGNMWLARCDYVARLRDPYDLKDGKLRLYQGGRISDWCWGYGRYFFEHWVHSHPSVKPCDLYPGIGFQSGYVGIPGINFEKNISMAPRFEYRVSAGRTPKRCKRYDMTTMEGYLEIRRRGYQQLYNMDVGGLNETWYLSNWPSSLASSPL